MMVTAHNTVFSDLPANLPVFPLYGVLLLPLGQLPLNIFEPRYKAMVEDSLRTNRIIGMIQPRTNENLGTGAEPLFDTGCAGRITSFTETRDNRYVITLTGICRFKVTEELPRDLTYRRVQANWTPFEKDLNPPQMLDLDRPRLKKLLEQYFALHDLSCEDEAIDGATDAKLITCLSMICPFEAGEKQALLEATCCHDRAAKFMSLLEMALPHGGCGEGCH